MIKIYFPCLNVYNNKILVEIFHVLHMKLCTKMLSAGVLFIVIINDYSHLLRVFLPHTCTLLKGFRPEFPAPQFVVHF